MPLSKDIHQSKALENISVAYRNEELIASLVAPVVPVKHETDKYYVYSKDNLRLEESFRANKAVSREVDWNLSTATYTLEKHGLKHLISDDDRKNADAALDLEVDATEMLTDKLLMRREKSVIDLVHTASNWSNVTSLTSTYAWSADTTLSNPIRFVDSACSSILAATGKRANTMVINDGTFRAAKEHVSVIDRVKYTSMDSVTEGILAKLFNIGKVLVSRAIINTQDEGASVGSVGFVMTDCAWIGYVDPNPGLKKPSALYTFVQTNDNDNLYSVKKWRDEEREGDCVEVGTKYNAKIVASDCAYLIINTVQ